MATCELLTPTAPKTKTNKTADLIRWGQLHGSSPALAISQLALAQTSPVLLITQDTSSALKLWSEIDSLLADEKIGAYFFPDWETLAYDTFSPHQDIISQRLHTLNKLQQKSGVFVVAVNTLLMKLAPTSFMQQYTLMLNKNEKTDIQQMRDKLSKAGYRLVDQVMEHGEFSVRGSLLDLFPMGSQHPYRIDFFDDEVDSIRLFDPETQRSGEEIAAIDLLPAHEFPTDEAGIEKFRLNWREQFEPSTDKESIYYQVSKKIMPAGIEYYLPLFFDDTASLFDYLPQDATLVLAQDIQTHAEHFQQEVGKRYENRRYDKSRPILSPNQLFLTPSELFAQLKNFGRVQISNQAIEEKAGRVNFETAAITEIAINAQLKQPTALLEDFIKTKTDRVLFLTESQGRRETLLELLKPAKLKPKTQTSIQDFITGSDKIGVCVSDLEHSFLAKINQQNIAFITETELLGNRVIQRSRKTKKGGVTTTDSVIKNLAELTHGQAVVHINHGVGRYQGLQTIDAGGIPTEFVTLEYADSKLYVPVSSLHLIARYTGGESDNAPLNKLSSDAWEKAKRKALEKVRDVAADLLDIYARRSAKPGFAFKLDADNYRQFSAGFPFEETEDQQNAIQNVLADMQTPNAMDRLVCGDVGFGKTEVAMRAAYVAINESKQVAVLVPTTLLAQQHYENFKDRFADWPVKVEVLSRFKTAKEQNAVLAQLAEGKVDIIIGTHKLLSKDVQFADLGLLIVDEEHRFGVKQKELIKSRRADVDILTLTATPIPRTLNMAMSGMRDLSIIATPPKKRLAVKTFVRQYDENLVKEAITREIMRGGQVYFLHNAVETIEKTAQKIQELVPEANVIVAHGQMRERELEHVMSEFYHNRYNVLVCTTIIETGIDIPTANTIILDRADNFGLAQLHQLRGRVGRSHHQAYAYLLTPHPKRMTKDAQKRLAAIENLEDLGAGFALATHDLEIRGAGELLGEDQSGQISSIGFSLYMDMLEQAVEALKQGKEPSLDDVLQNQTEVELRIPALLPDDYIADVNLRLSLYKRLAGCKTADELDDFQVELIDRFGLLPDAAKNLIKVNTLRIKASKLGIKRLEAGPKGGVIEFSQQTKVDPGFIIGLIQSQPKYYSMAGPDKLRFNITAEDTRERIKLVDSMLNDFAQKITA
ncbi:transcription-repair coupling factor [Catenovulum sp. 2E275]|uniref:transcription-repair coupling factor n=1 Tax=Catenovulum sp. 2E275 TaxID=2980497 RepID=UPI0021D28705|nr:transcription-repair coupling factor [Catenovulum sp. 2E275]MCU4676690.1 transcription-repair coupling factor [Catenovulum sp. 2E275]